MEVHHHTHHPKKWKEYFWEFFMLFLAVFCGFLAELQLEHFIEDQRERKYINHIMQDLSKDSLNLNTFISGTKRRTERIDSLLNILINNESSTKGDDAYFHARRLVRAPYYFPSDASILQLKYSGNFRLIHDAKLVTKIGSYENETRELMEFLNESNESNRSFRESLETIFDGKVFNTMLDSTSRLTKPTNNPQLLTTNFIEINKLIIKLQFMKGGALKNIQLAERCLNSCLLLRKDIVKKYKL